MRYGIFGDIHANLEAFEKVIDAYKKESIDKYICAGDIVGYGVDHHKCIEALKELGAKSVCGNHDWAAAGLLGADYFNEAARLANEWTKAHLTKEEKIFLGSLELLIKEKDFVIVHGSLDRPDFFNYILDTASAIKTFRIMEEKICFIGHSHVPMIFFMEGGAVGYTFEGRINMKQAAKYIVNVGSVGQPRDSDPRACFCVYDSDNAVIEIRRIDYDTETAKDKIINAGLPERLGYRLIQGK